MRHVARLAISCALLVCAATSSHAEGYVNPFIGVNFANNSGNGRSNFGINAGWLGASIAGAEFDFGQFVTSAGAEVIESSSNWNYTRSLLFAWAIPYYHFGFRSSVPVTKELTVGLQVVNAWNTVWGNNNMQNIGLTTAYTKPKYTWSFNYYEGPNHPGTSTGKRNLFDSTLLLTPNSKLVIRRVNAKAPAKPITSPTKVRVISCPTTRLSTSR